MQHKRRADPIKCQPSQKNKSIERLKWLLIPLQSCPIVQKKSLLCKIKISFTRRRKECEKFQVIPCECEKNVQPKFAWHPMHQNASKRQLWNAILKAEQKLKPKKFVLSSYLFRFKTRITDDDAASKRFHPFKSKL